MRYELEQIGLKAKTEAVPTSQLFARSGNPKSGELRHGARSGGRPTIRIRRTSSTCCSTERQIPDEGASNNWSFFNSPKYNALMDKAALMTGDARYKAYGNLDIAMMKDAAPAAPYINSNNRILVSSRISNFMYNDANTNTAWNALVIK